MTNADLDLRTGSLGSLYSPRGAKLSRLLLYQARSHEKYRPLGRAGKVRRLEIFSVEISLKTCLGRSQWLQVLVWNPSRLCRLPI